MSDLRKLLAVDARTTKLADIDPRSTPGLPQDREIRKDPKGWSTGEVNVIGLQLANYQERLFAAAKEKTSARRVVLVLQAMDCGGKDGTVRAIARGMNPAGLKSVGFGSPTAEERAHDFLWRIERALPPAGSVGIFNRSQYEDVLVVRVRNLVPEKEWSARYAQINDFEAAQAGEGVTWLKVMLHISPDEQKERLLARLDDPTKYWKYNPDDLAERARWDDYQMAYQDALTKCSTDVAPWYVVPADRKWYRNWAVATLLHETLAELNPQYPPADFDISEEREKLRRA
jgi:PPK2 family polyphosphate:nucleotide phosphotransferase